MQDTLIVYYSRTGRTRLVAELLVPLLHADIAEITENVLVQREMDKAVTLIRDSGASEVCAFTRSWGSAPDPGVL